MTTGSARGIQSRTDANWTSARDRLRPRRRARDCEHRRPVRCAPRPVGRDEGWQILLPTGALSPGRRVSMNKRRWVTYGLLSGVLVLTAWAASAMPRKSQALLPSHDPISSLHPNLPQTVQIPKAPPRVEIVFAL